MSSKAFIIFLLAVISQNISWSQRDTTQSLINFQANIDEIVKVAIEQRAFPGCVVLAYHKDTVLYSKAYGYHTYDSLTETQLTDLFDLASLTKACASTLALMRLYEGGYFKLDDPLGKHLKHLGLKGLKKATFRQVLAHQAGLHGWHKYYLDLISRNDTHKKRWVTTDSTGFPLSDSLFLTKSYYPQIRKAITRSKLQKEPQFVYSDLFFYLIPELIKSWTGTPFDEFMSTQFYEPLGASSLVFNPVERFPLARVVPTEKDTFFRKTLIHGYVHDEGAILMNGVSGHAGLFGSAEDLAKLWRMLLNEGTIGQDTILKESTISLFTSYQFPSSDNRRALGFDKPLLEYDSIKSSVARQASGRSYGHTGFTGTLAWADPESDLLFIFLSNRVYPTRESRAIYELNVRPQIHGLLYELIDQIKSNPCDK